MTYEGAQAQWERCKSWIADALEHAKGTHTIDDVEKGIHEGLYHFWPGKQSAAITEIHEFPRKKHLHIFLAGGNLDELRQMVPDFMSWAKYLGCSRLTIAGRKGWERALKDQGWQAGVVCLALEIGK